MFKKEIKAKRRKEMAVRRKTKKATFLRDKNWWCRG